MATEFLQVWKQSQETRCQYKDIFLHVAKTMAKYLQDGLESSVAKANTSAVAIESNIKANQSLE